MSHVSKRRKGFASKVDRAKSYPAIEALKLVKDTATAKIDEAVDADIELVFWKNPVRFFAQSGRLDLDENAQPETKVDQRELWEGNSVLRGQAPRVD